MWYDPNFPIDQAAATIRALEQSDHCVQDDNDGVHTGDDQQPESNDRLDADNDAEPASNHSVRTGDDQQSESNDRLDPENEEEPASNGSLHTDDDQQSESNHSFHSAFDEQLESNLSTHSGRDQEAESLHSAHSREDQVPESNLDAQAVPDTEAPGIDAPEPDALEVNASEPDAPAPDASEPDAPAPDASEDKGPDPELPSVRSLASDALAIAISNAKCVVTTCASAESPSIRQNFFPRVVMNDEAGYGHSLEVNATLVSRIERGESALAVFIGDTKQLSPVVTSKYVKKADETDFNPFWDQLQTPWYAQMEKAGHEVTMFREQNRMAPGLAEFSNKKFYDGKLRDSPEIAFANRPIACSVLNTLLGYFHCQ